ncbi:hypothetical protein D3C86_1437710 [compost metagenome]
MRLGRDRAEHGGVLDRVVRTEVGTQLGHHRFVERGVAGRREVREHIEHRRVLATEGQAAELVALHAHVSLTTEQAAALLRAAIVEAKTGFQHEQRLQAATQVFGAAQAPTRAGQAAAGLQADAAAATGQRRRAAIRAPRRRIGVEARCQVVVIFDRHVHDAVQRHARLGVCRAGKRAHRGKRD